MTARDEILTAAARALQSVDRSARAIASEARALLDAPDGMRPALPMAGTVESFVQRIAGPKVGATVDHVARLEDLPVAVARYLTARNLEPRITLQPTAALTALDWAGTGIRLGNAPDEGIVVGLALWGIAETGSLVFHSAADMPILDNFLGSIHIVAVPASVIVPYLEDYAVNARLAGDPAPRNACLITGPSGTTDIEGSLVKGAHGPMELHVVVIESLATGAVF